MANIKIEILNADKIVNAFLSAPEIFAQEFNMAMGQIGQYTVIQIKEIIRHGTNMWKAPVDTGAMMGGIYSQQVNPYEVYIMPSVITPYATYVHEGTRNMKARPFFEITASEKKEAIQDRVNVLMEKIVNRIVSQTK